MFIVQADGKPPKLPVTGEPVTVSVPVVVSPLSQRSKLATLSASDSSNPVFVQFIVVNAEQFAILKLVNSGLLLQFKLVSVVFCSLLPKEGSETSKNCRAGKLLAFRVVNRLGTQLNVVNAVRPLRSSVVNCVLLSQFNVINAVQPLTLSVVNWLLLQFNVINAVQEFTFNVVSMALTQDNTVSAVQPLTFNVVSALWSLILRDVILFNPETSILAQSGVCGVLLCVIVIVLIAVHF